MAREVRRPDRPNLGGARSTAYAPRRSPRQPRHLPRLKPILLSLGLVLASGLFWQLGLVRDISVRNVRSPQAAAAKVRAQIESTWLGRHLFWLSSDELAARLETAYPDQFAEVNIHKDWLKRGITVEFVERQAVLSWQTTQGTYGVDQRGIITGRLKRVGESALPLVVDRTNLEVKPGQGVAPSRFVSFTLALSDELRQFKNFRLERAEVRETTSELMAVINRPYYLRLDTTRTAASQLEALKALLDNGAHPSAYIDLRLPHKAYYR